MVIAPSLLAADLGHLVREARKAEHGGADWLHRIGEVSPTAIVLTHAHSDHVDGLRAGAPCPVYATADALKQAYDQASAGWANLPAESKAGLATACKAGADAVMQSAKATCGW